MCCMLGIVRFTEHDNFPCSFNLINNLYQVSGNYQEMSPISTKAEKAALIQWINFFFGQVILKLVWYHKKQKKEKHESGQFTEFKSWTFWVSTCTNSTDHSALIFFFKSYVKWPFDFQDKIKGTHRFENGSAYISVLHSDQWNWWMNQCNLTYWGMW